MSESYLEWILHETNKLLRFVHILVKRPPDASVALRRIQVQFVGEIDKYKIAYILRRNGISQALSMVRVGTQSKPSFVVFSINSEIEWAAEPAGWKYFILARYSVHFDVVFLVHQYVRID